MNPSSIRAMRFPWRQHWRYLIRPALQEVLDHMSASTRPACVVGALFTICFVGPETPWQELCSLFLIIAVPTYVVALGSRIANAINLDDLERHWTPLTRLWRRFRTAGSALSAEALLRVAYHEVGHLIVYASLSPVKGSLDIEVVDDTDWEHLGAVRAELAGLVTRDALYRHSAGKLAGRLCSQHFLGPGVDGAVEDETRWIDLAKEYLTEYRPYGIFYPLPVRAEVQYNNEQLAQLRARQESELTQLFETNRDWITSMVDRLVVERHLRSPDLEEALNRVQWRGIVTS